MTAFATPPRPNLVERRRSCGRPPRCGHHLSEAGRHAHSVIVALLAWGNRRLAPEAASVAVLDAAASRQRTLAGKDA